MSEWKNGLPPVGETCEMSFGDGDPFTSGYVAYYGKKILVWVTPYGNETSCSQSWCTFRPLKSEVERKRDEAVEEMVKLCPYPGSKLTEIDCEALYDAGLRKVNPLTDEQVDRVKYSTRYDFGECSYETAAYREGMRDARRIIMGEES